MVYCMTETNLCPSGPETWGCPINKGSAAALPRYTSAICPTEVRRTSAAGQVVLTFIIMLPLLGLWSLEAGNFISTYIGEMAVTRRFAVAALPLSPYLV
jgi:hypothetical protein